MNKQGEIPALKPTENTPSRGSNPGGMKASAGKVTPMIAQFIEIKANNPDCLLFYRMGDFYELFFEDAEIASRALGITLTKRGKHEGEDIPMCGVPVRAADNYLQRLIRLGHRVAVCEQLEDPVEARKRGTKAVVRRDVVRLVTPGTLTEDSLLDARRNNYLVAVARNRGGGSPAQEVALAWLDISTGSFKVGSCEGPGMASYLSRLGGSEIILSEQFYEDPQYRTLWQEVSGAVAPLTRDYFDSSSAERRLRDYFQVGTLDAFGAFTRAELAACGAMIAYIDATQVGQRPSVSPPQRQVSGEVMEIDAATRTNLELFRSTDGDVKGGLYAAIDRTVTPAGARALADHLSSPLTDPDRINERLDTVEYFFENGLLRDAVRAELRASADIVRALSRLSLGRGGPRDLGGLRDGLKTAQELKTRIGAATGLTERPRLIAQITDALTGPQIAGGDEAQIVARLDATIGVELPLLARDGGFVQPGHSQPLDEARILRDESRKFIAGLQATYGALTGIKALKVRHNNVLGYFVEVPGQHGQKLMEPPLNETFIHRQTMANAMRFTTTELGELESRIAAAADRALAIEIEIFEELRALVLSETDAIKAAAEALAALDVHSALAELATDSGCVRPKMDLSTSFKITGGRHPVVEEALRREGGTFVANDCDLGLSDEETANGAENSKGAIWLVTGPNMAGKSTFLRQNAVIAILAQMGAFVPAQKAEIGIVDRLFSRVGASDDLARGRSTFMVEMVETAAILNQAGPRSLVILDEIGRGTATFDGLSIAWSTIEHLHEVNGARALFATHYHELTGLTEKLNRLKNATMKVKEWKGDVVFLHEVVAGTSDRSYGIQVAKLAGLPASVIARAGEVLTMLESSDAARAGQRLADDLPLFNTNTPKPAGQTVDPVTQQVLEQIQQISPDELTPRDALELLYSLKAVLKTADKS